MSGAFAALKIAALVAFGAAGLVWIAQGHALPAHAATATTTGGWLGVVLLLMFAYGGFESALIPMGESRNPQRDAPWALLVAFAAVVVVYALVQVVVLATLPDPGATDRPLAAAGGVILGRAGSVAMAFVAITSVFGWGSAIMAAALGVSADRLVTPFQIHSPDVVVVQEPWTRDSRPRADAVVTQVPRLAIGVSTADCGPLLFADSEAGVIGAAHGECPSAQARLQPALSHWQSGMGQQ